MTAMHSISMRIVVPAAARLGLVVAVAVVVGLLFGSTAGLWFAALGFGLLLVIHLYYLGLLGAWLSAPAAGSVPNGRGAWAGVFANLYRFRRASEANERRLAENEERFRRTVSAMPEGIVLIDASLQIEWCNPVAEQHLGVRLAADVGLRLTNLVRHPSFIAYLDERRFDEPLVFRPTSNAALVLALQMIEFEPARSLVLTRDVTQAERVDAMRRDFLANVSHELRTPLTVVNGFLETLIDTDPPLDELRARHLRLMHEQGQRMHRLIEDLLMLSRLESQDAPEQDEVIEVAPLLTELVDEARVLSAHRHTIVLDVSAGGVRGSRSELRSAFGNLVFNAVRYTPPGGRVLLRWETVDDGLVFSVTDTGIGIAAEHIPRITERFYRVDKGRSRETGGTGLGLAIVKHVALRHQGRLEIRSQLGAGSTFSVWLPAARRVEPVPVPASG